MDTEIGNLLFCLLFYNNIDTIPLGAEMRHSPDSECWNKETVVALRREMSPYLQPSLWRSVRQLINTLIPYILLWILAYRLLQYSYWLALPFIILAGGFVIRLFIFFHDCGHGSFFRSKKANDLCGIILGIPTLTPYYYWRNSHARHHATSGNLDKRGEGDVWMMTVAEYAPTSFWKRSLSRFYRNPFVMFLLGPLLILLITHRIPLRKATAQERLSVYGTDLGIILISLAIIELTGLKAFLLIQLPSLYIGLAAGIWLFYVQHQYEGVYWAREKEWSFTLASLQGASFYKLPAVLKWFSGNIGFHHVHHLNPRIPNYFLPDCFSRIDPLKTVKPIGLIAGLKGLRYRLWDEDAGKLVGFRNIRNRPVEHEKEQS